MIWFNSCNALVCMPAEPQRWINACQKMDFNVVQDLFMTPTAMALCDLFLPVSTFIEHDGVVQIHYGRHTPYLGAPKRGPSTKRSKTSWTTRSSRLA